MDQKPVDICQTRLDALESLIALCRCRIPLRQAKRFETIMKEWDVEDQDTFDFSKLPLQCHSTQCLFCLGDNHIASEAARYANNSSPKKYAKLAHFRHLKEDQAFVCPHPSCDQLLDSAVHFKSQA